MWPFAPSYPTRTPEHLNEEYDYIIVGGGTAGCVLARRLAEDRNSTVLLIERGDADDSWLNRCPLLSCHYWSDKKHSIVIESTNDTSLMRPSTIITGVGLGGTSRINSMQYARGSPGDYNAWAEAGRVGWGYSDLLPYFEKSECLYEPMTKSHYGNTGLWQIQTPRPFQFKISESFTRAAEKLGFPLAQDVNDSLLPTSGCFKVHHTIDRSGQRNSTFRAYLPKQFVLDHVDNFHVCTKSIVRKVEISSSGSGTLEATGVILQAFDVGSPMVVVGARKEVILAAGALRTPQLLLLSGVGPEAHLHEVGIPMIKNMIGVGSGLQDHLGVNMGYNCPLEDSILAVVKKPRVLISQAYRYLAKGDGWFTSSLVESSIMTRSTVLDALSSQRPLTDSEKDASLPENIPDIEIMANVVSDPRVPNFDKSQGGFGFLVALLRPVSNGTVRLRSSNPFDEPLCDMQYLSSPEDREVFRLAVRLCMRLADEMRAAGYALRGVCVPPTQDDSTVDTFTREFCDSYYHYSSSCRMAPEDDAAAPGVVDDALRVHGVAKLRVCDASIFPRIPATHLQAPVVATAEKCADLILKVSRRV